VTRSKKVFIGFSLFFLLLLLYASYDIAKRTTFPGSKPQLKERIEENYFENDTVRSDTAYDRGGSEKKKSKK
jgi:hypothetical protein